MSTKDVTFTTASEFDPDALLANTALSLTGQPNLLSLVTELVHSTRPVTFVVGAGTSLDAGLPTWGQLLDNIAEQIVSDRWRHSALDDRGDPARKAEYLRHLAMEQSDAEAYQVVRRALYKRNVKPTPGPLADSLARLASSLGDRARIITTNFDVVLETAIERYQEALPRTFTLHDETAWEALSAEHDGRLPVLHLHGILEPNLPPREPLVLTESEFLREGPRARRLIVNELKSRVVIFVGVSLTDPNLVGPLWDTRGTRIGQSHVYTFAVAHGHSSEERAYSVKTASLLGEELRLRTVHAKSYSQQTQMFQDLSLALRRSSEYIGSEGEGGPLHYGARFVEGLNRCYSAIGCGPDQQLPEGAAATDLSENLRRALRQVTTLIAQKLNDVRHSSDASLADQAARIAASTNEEHFGLFLWLRARAEYGDNRPYAIRMMGTSTYTHHEPWSLDREADIVPESRHTAARALYFGTSQMQNLPGGAEWKLWRGCIAVPLSVSGLHDVELDEYDAAYDTITPGVLTLNTTNHVTRPNGISDAEWQLRASALSVVTASIIREISDQVVLQVRPLIRGNS